MNSIIIYIKKLILYVKHFNELESLYEERETLKGQYVECMYAYCTYTRGTKEFNKMEDRIDEIHNRINEIAERIRDIEKGIE